MRHILKCVKCRSFTMHEKCRCGGEAATIKPAKFSPEDRFGEYRRKAKEDEWRRGGLL